MGDGILPAKGFCALGRFADDRYCADARELRIPPAFEVLDETQEVAKAYRAACTPDFFLFDAGHQLVYRGQYDDSRPSNGVAVTGADLQQAVQAVLGQGEMSAEQKPSIGCNIKWKGGAEPDYFNPQGVQ